MIKYLIFFLILSIHTELFSQPHVPVRAKNDSSYFMAVEEMPYPEGGVEAIQDSLIYPEIAKRDRVEGKVYVLAYINEEGEVVKTEVLKGAGSGLDESACYAVRSVKFKPGRQDGIPVKVQVVVPIIFRLD